MTIDRTQYDLMARIRATEEEIRKLKRRPVEIPGVQILTDGTLFAQGGIAFGAGRQVISEPSQVPLPTGLELSWGASFDTIFIDVSWSAPDGYGADQVVSYLVQATKFGGLGVPIQSTVVTTSTRLEPVEPNSTYTVTVSGITRTGRTSSVITDTILTGGDTTAPGAPTFPAGAVAEGVEALSIHWNANTERDVVNGKGQYRVRVSVNADLSSPAYDGKVGGTVAWVGNLTAGTAYYVGVNAIDSSGNSSVLGTPTGGPWTPTPIVTDTSAFAFGGGNIIRDSGFESPLVGEWWAFDPAFAEVVATQNHGGFGNHSTHVKPPAGDVVIRQDVSLGKGNWIISAWAKGSAVAAFSGPAIGVFLGSEVMAGTITGFETILGAPLDQGASAGVGTFDWTRLAFKCNVTSASATLRVYLQRGGLGPCVGDAWFDEVQVEQGDTITGYAPRPDEILSNTIKATQIGDGEIITPKLAANSVVAGKIAANAIGANEIQAASITGGKIAGSTITGTNIAGDTITGANVQAGSLGADRIAANSITAGQLAANSVSADELAAVSMAVGKFIQSVGYVPNTAGWAIQGDGSAEFNNVSIRGTLNAARLGTDLFDFMRPTGSIAARFQFTGPESRFFLGEGAVNANQYMYYQEILGRWIFKGGDANNPAWEFTQRAQFTNGAYSTGQYSSGQWGSVSGYYVASNANGVPDTDWGVGFGWDGGSAFTAMLQGNLNSTVRHVGLANTNGGVQQVYIDGGSGSPADTRSLTRTGWIVYSDPSAKTDIKPLAKTVTSARETVGKLQPLRYKMRHRIGNRYRLSTRHQLGFSAEDVKEILPDAVHEDVSFQLPEMDADGNPKPVETGLGIQYDAFIPLLVAANHEQDAEIAELRELVGKLAEQVQTLESARG